MNVDFISISYTEKRLEISGQPCKNCDTSFPWQFISPKWDQVRWQSNSFLSKCRGNSVAWLDFV